MENFKVEAAEGMIKFGGSFTSNLGGALIRADTINAAKIIKMFRKECEEHATLYKVWMEKMFKNGYKEDD